MARAAAMDDENNSISFLANYNTNHMLCTTSHRKKKLNSNYPSVLDTARPQNIV